ncbi:MAG: acyltransferase [Parafilimonas sp.]|nr:acyltransferase [Parafilimonas sp.]
MNKEGGLSHKLHGLDHLRAFAIMFVFFFHYGRLFPHPEWTNSISTFGWTGVDLFFVLSGYLIASQLFKKIAQQNKISVKEFFIKRFFRIIPIYLFVVALYFLFPFTHEREALAPLWKYLTFTQNIGLNIQTQGTFSHAWSLCIEEQFYLFFPLILIAATHFKISKNAYWLLILLFVFGFCIRAFCYNQYVKTNDENSWQQWYKYIYYATWSRLDGLIVGVSIAALLQFKPVISNSILQQGNKILLAAAVIFTVTYFLLGDEQSFAASVFGFPLVDIGYGFIVLAALSPKCFLYKYESKITNKIAVLSYGIYLVHKIVIHVIQTQFSNLNIHDDSNAMLAICIATVFITSFILNETIEKPFLKLRKKILVKNQRTNSQRSYYG